MGGLWVRHRQVGPVKQFGSHEHIGLKRHVSELIRSISIISLKKNIGRQEDTKHKGKQFTHKVVKENLEQIA